jgi:hypothetical protein
LKASLDSSLLLLTESPAPEAPKSSGGKPGKGRQPAKKKKNPVGNGSSSPSKDSGKGGKPFKHKGKPKSGPPKEKSAAPSERAPATGVADGGKEKKREHAGGPKRPFKKFKKGGDKKKSG